MSSSRKVLLHCVLLLLVSQLLFLINIQFPRGHNFDEFHYVPSATQFLAMTKNQNWEHPPLAKELMAVGIGIFGDRPLGWRYMSTLFGSLTLVGMYAWALALFADTRIALWAALITLVNQLLYVQARIGMLDTFMFAFLTWGAAAFTATWRPGTPLRQIRWLLAFSGLMFGFGTACKWFGLIPLAACIATVAVIRVLQRWRARFEAPDPDDWYRPDLWSGITIKDWGLSLGVAPAVAYLLTFTPFFFIPNAMHGLLDLFAMQKRMWEGQLRVVGSHPYMSSWIEWPLIRRPIWYAFDHEGDHDEYLRGVVLLGNPFIMWTGLVALLGCLWGWIAERSRAGFVILLFYAAYCGSWIVVPRKVSFYYYYYPAGTTLSLALAYVFFHDEKGSSSRFPWARWAFFGVSLAVFVYFFPILAALRIDGESLRKWMWSSTWI
ncbi:phospholipid carrier-dependent glycosyltransferase [Sorangium sp. So ce1128]